MIFTRRFLRLSSGVVVWSNGVRGAEAPLLCYSNRLGFTPCEEQDKKHHVRCCRLHDKSRIVRNSRALELLADRSVVQCSHQPRSPCIAEAWKGWEQSC